ncbi:MAG: hypothetical protein O7F76_01055, partial [Planctomycetota bacterium]|nr:hypothetical protein [Planctomycetota bacterium]
MASGRVGGSLCCFGLGCKKVQLLRLGFANGVWGATSCTLAEWPEVVSRTGHRGLDRQASRPWQPGRGVNSAARNSSSPGQAFGFEL